VFKLSFLEIVWLPKAIGEAEVSRETVRIFRKSLAVEVRLGLTRAISS